jgi:predicted amidohydrolase YtcJ
MLRLFAVLALAAVSLAAADADLILHHGKVVTVDAGFSIQQAVAIKSGKIVRVGSDRAVLAERGPSTRVIDLAGRTVLPGLIDAHVHTQEAGLSEFRGPLPPLDTFPAIQAYIRQQAAKTPKGKWIVVPRTFPTRLTELRMPTRDTLDAGSTDHPVMFDASYVVVANSLALTISGITRHTPNPPGGEIVKDARGEPNGILKNAQGLLLGIRRSESFTEADRMQAIEDQLKRYLAAGLTTVGDRANSASAIALWQRMKAQGRLPMRVVLTYRPDASRPEADVVDEVNAQPFTTNTGDDWLRIGTFKLTLDGGMTIGTAYQRYPYGPFGKQLYGKTNPDDRGMLFIPPPKLAAIMEAARAKGWQMTTHDQGGGAIDNFLDAMETLNRTRPIAPTRSHVMHASFQSPDAIARMAKLGLLADVQGQWLLLDGPALEKVFGYDGMRYFYPLRSYRNAGIVIAAGSDHMIGHDKNRAVNPYNPFLSMWIMVARKTWEGKVIHSEEKLTREEALRAHTIWAAHLQFGEKVKGSIEAGKLADLVVVDRDYLTCPEDDIRAIEPVMTVLDGKVVWERR